MIIAHKLRNTEISTPNYAKVMAFRICKDRSKFALEHGRFLQKRSHTVRLIKKFTFRTKNMHICVVHLTYLTLLLPRTHVLAGVRVVRVYRLKFLRSLAN